ncbi:hypothetical protein Tco_0897163 [Tanacetum coccineum]
MSRANPQAAIVYEDKLIPCANRLKITKNNQRVASYSNVTDKLLKLVMPPPVTNKPFTKPPTDKQHLAFIKTLGYDEDTKQKMFATPHFVATRLLQTWRAILGVLNKFRIRKDTSWDIARISVLQILWVIVHSANLDYASLIWDEFE